MPKEFDRCVKDVEKKGNVDNPYAVCRSSMGTDKDIQRRRGIHKRRKKPIRKTIRPRRF